MQNNLLLVFLVTTLAIHPGHVRAAGDPTGISELFMPFVYLLRPVYMVKTLLFGSDEKSRLNTEAEANRIISELKEPIPVKGLYVGTLNLKFSISGILIDSRIPFVETDIAAAQWLIEQAAQPKELMAGASGNVYLRVSLGEKGNLHCLKWKSPNDDWANKVPLRPGTCLKVTFEKNLLSEVELRVNTEKVPNRQLRWELLDRTSGKVLLSLPFWQPQTENSPLSVSTNYRERYENSPFSKFIKMLKPSPENLNSDGKSFVLSWNDPHYHGHVETVYLTAKTTPASVAWPEMERKNESYEQGYRRAYDSNKAVLINNHLVFLPKLDKVGNQWPFTFGPRAVDDRFFVTAQYQPGKLNVKIFGYLYDGAQLWNAEIAPDIIPEDVKVCEEKNSSCYFFPSAIRITGDSLIVLGSYELPRNQHSKKIYEWSVPLDRLPKVQAM